MFVPLFCLGLVYHGKPHISMDKKHKSFHRKQGKSTKFFCRIDRGFYSCYADNEHVHKGVMDMNPKERKQSRVQLFRDAANFK